MPKFIFDEQPVKGSKIAEKFAKIDSINGYIVKIHKKQAIVRKK